MSDVETAEKAPLSAKVGPLVESIKTLSVMELVELKGALEDEFGVTAAAPAMGMMINRKVWQSFTKDQQLMHLKKSAMHNHGSCAWRGNRKRARSAVREGSVQITTSSPSAFAGKYP